MAVMGIGSSTPMRTCSPRLGVHLEPRSEVQGLPQRPSLWLILPEEWMFSLATRYNKSMRNCSAMVAIA